MHYPFWYVPGLTSPMLIAIVATVHVFVSMFAVGGSFVMALGVRAATRDGVPGLKAYFGRFAWFFVLATVVFGAVTGLGIWWTIGLASPLATEELIHIFVFLWAVEYTSFIAEVVSAFVFLYGWRRLDTRTLQQVLWIYAGAAWASLVAITGITAFMLNTGGWRTGDTLWQAFWNPQAIPQIVARTGTSLLLAALFIFLHSAFALAQDERLRCEVSQRAARWAMLGGALVITGGGLWYGFAPPSARAALIAASALNLLMTALFGMTAVVVIMLYLGPYRNPRWVTPGFALLFMATGFAATAAGEFVREATRKPYIIYGSILANGIRASEVRRAQTEGYLNQGVWTRQYLSEHHPGVLDGQGRVDPAKLLAAPRKEREQIGEVIYQYHCNDCHSVDGYSAMSQLTRGWTREMIDRTIPEMNRAHFFMPPWSGTREEAKVVGDFVESVSRPYPPGLVPEEEAKQ